MKLTESRKAMIARHVHEFEQAVGAHRNHLATLVERQRLEMMELMLVEDTRQKPNDLIALMISDMKQCIAGENPGGADYQDGMGIIRMLERFAAEKLPDKDAE